MISAGFPVIEEKIRRDQLFQPDTLQLSFLFRPAISYSDSSAALNENFFFNATPALITTGFDLNRPIPNNPFLLTPGTGFSTYATAGIFIKFKGINFQLQPEFAFSQNRPFEGTPEEWSDQLMQQRFWDWNFGDFPQRFGNRALTKIWWGQSKLTIQLGAFELGASSQNIWWGPGQWNSLLFSNNAPGFPHLTLNTYKPAKLFLGNLEMQLLIGRLESSNQPPLDDYLLNNRFFKPLSSDWRYLNAINVSFNPKWVPHLFLGFGRTFQVYNDSRGNSFIDWFPVFEAFQKEKFFSNGNSIDFDSNDRDQQLAVFARYKISKAKAEMYFEYGRRDHAFNWREFALNPEHARAYLFGFIKLFNVDNSIFQLRGEVTHQQESVNRYIRYLGQAGYHSWHMHDTQRGFTNFGQPIGVRLGPGSNNQILEFAKVDGYQKIGVFFERLENNQGFFYRAFGQQNEVKPWIDLSFGFLYDKKINNFLINSQIQMISSQNYQWQLSSNSTSQFPQGKNLFTFHSRLSLIYLWNNVLK